MRPAAACALFIIGSTLLAAPACSSNDSAGDVTTGDSANEGVVVDTAGDAALDGTWEATATEHFCAVGPAIDMSGDPVTTSPADGTLLQGWQDLRTLTIDGDSFDGERPCGEVAGPSQCEGTIVVSGDELHVTALECDDTPLDGGALPDAEITVEDDTLVIATKGSSTEYERG